MSSTHQGVQRAADVFSRMMEDRQALVESLRTIDHEIRIIRHDAEVQVSVLEREKQPIEEAIGALDAVLKSRAPLRVSRAARSDEEQKSSYVSAAERNALRNAIMALLKASHPTGITGVDMAALLQKKDPVTWAHLSPIRVGATASRMDPMVQKNSANEWVYMPPGVAQQMAQSFLERLAQQEADDSPDEPALDEPDEPDEPGVGDAVDTDDETGLHGPAHGEDDLEPPAGGSEQG